MAAARLADLIQPCGPVVAGGVPGLTADRLAEAAEDGGWRDLWEQARVGMGQQRGLQPLGPSPGQAGEVR